MKDKERLKRIEKRVTALLWVCVVTCVAAIASCSLVSQANALTKTDWQTLKTTEHGQEAIEATERWL